MQQLFLETVTIHLNFGFNRQSFFNLSQLPLTSLEFLEITSPRNINLFANTKKSKIPQNIIPAAAIPIIYSNLICLQIPCSLSQFLVVSQHIIFHRLKKLLLERKSERTYTNTNIINPQSNLGLQFPKVCDINLIHNDVLSLSSLSTLNTLHITSYYFKSLFNTNTKPIRSLRRLSVRMIDENISMQIIKNFPKLFPRLEYLFFQHNESLNVEHLYNFGFKFPTKNLTICYNRVDTLPNNHFSTISTTVFSNLSFASKKTKIIHFPSLLVPLPLITLHSWEFLENMNEIKASIQIYISLTPIRSVQIPSLYHELIVNFVQIKPVSRTNSLRSKSKSTLPVFFPKILGSSIRKLSFINVGLHHTNFKAVSSWDLTGLPKLHRFTFQFVNSLNHFPNLVSQTLKKLIISDCANIKTIPDTLGTSLPKLQNFTISSCPRFVGFPQSFASETLTTITISSSGITSIPENFTLNFPNLQSFICDQTQNLKTIPMLKSTNLNHISFKGCHFIFISNSISLPNLKHLEIQLTPSKTPKSSRPDILKSKSSLRSGTEEIPIHLNYNSNRPPSSKEFDSSLLLSKFSASYGLERLSIPSSQLHSLRSTDIPQNIIHLECTFSHFSSLPLLCLSNLETLDLRGASITMIPSEFGHSLPKLVNFDLRESKIITHFPSIYGASLQTINISHSSISTLERPFGRHLPHLETFDISGTHISHLPIFIAPSLRYLITKNCPISTVEPFFDQRTQISQIGPLNELVSLTPLGSSQLQQLLLSHSNIATIDPRFGQTLFNLKILHLAFLNKISFLPDIFCQSLEILNLSNSSLSLIHPQFGSGLPSLLEISFYHCKRLRDVPPLKFKSLQFLDLSESTTSLFRMGEINSPMMEYICLMGIEFNPTSCTTLSKRIFPNGMCLFENRDKLFYRDMKKPRYFLSKPQKTKSGIFRQIFSTQLE